MRSPQMVRTVVVVGGVDPGGGAGLLRDVATARALGAQPIAVGTAWTEQGMGIHRVEPRDPAAVAESLARAIRAARPAAVKVGMAVEPAVAEALLAGLASYRGPVVVDPVLATSRGGSLWRAEPAALLGLLRRATLATPNGPEAAALTGRPVVTEEDAGAAARHLVEQEGLAAVLVKGGHLAGPGAIVDVLVTPAGLDRIEHPRIDGPSPRGTGCALATAVAIQLGQGESLLGAIQKATRWLAGAIAAATPVGGELHMGTPE